MSHNFYDGYSRGNVINKGLHVVNDHIDYVIMNDTSFMHSFMNFIHEVHALIDQRSL